MSIVSILISTRNRAECLRDTLGALAAVQVPVGVTAELIIADNGSTDGTAQLVRDFESGVGAIELGTVYEPRQGKSRALNRALARARGDVLLFTDDDVRPPKEWIGQMAGPLLSGSADAVAGGIRILGSLRRPWLGPLHRQWLASTEDKPRDAPHPMIGANMAVARHVFDRVPGFDPEVGPGAIGHAEDTLFWLQVRAAGFRIVNRLDVEVEHCPTPDRITAHAFRRLARKNGEFAAYVDHHWNWIDERHPYAATARAAAKLWAARIVHLRSWLTAPVPPEWELKQLEVFHLRRHMMREQKRPRNYPRHGLVKRNASSACGSSSKLSDIAVVSP